MSGTLSGGRKAAATNRRRHGADYYTRIGRLVKHRGAGGFGSEKIGKDGLTGSQRARIAGRKGGLMSPRTTLSK